MLAVLVSLLLTGQMLDSLNMRTVGRWPFSKLQKGTSKAYPPYYPVSERTLYVAAGGGFYVIDVSDPASVVKVDSFSMPGANRDWFSVSGDYCLTGQFKSGVALYDIRDQTRPVLVSTYLTPWYPMGGQLVGHHGFIVGNELKILDFTDPHQPMELGACAVPQGTDGVFVSGNYAYLAANYEGFIVIDIHDLRNPYEVFRFGYPPPGRPAARDIQVRDTVAYIAWTDAGLRIWNVRDPTAPREIGSFPGLIKGVTVVDTLAYVTRARLSTRRDDTLLILSVADPTRPYVLGRHRGTSAAVRGNRCYLLNPPEAWRRDDTLVILDVGDPRNPTVLGSYSQFHAMTDGIFVQGGLAYTATRCQGLKVYDVSEPRAPRLLSQLGSWLVNQVKVTPDRVAYLICEGGPVFRTVDVSDPQHPILLGTIDTTVYSSRVTVVDTLAFLSCDYSVWIVNVADPRSPRRISTIPSSPAFPYQCAVDGNLLFIPYTYGGAYLKIYDISDPTRPESLSRYNTEGAVSDVVIRHPYAYVVGSRFTVLDISSPREPRLVALRPVTGYGWSIALDGNLAYVAESFDGVRVYDVSDPAQPTEVGRYVTPVFANEVRVQNGLVYVADSDGWLVLEQYQGGVAERSGDHDIRGSIHVSYQFSSRTLKVKLPPGGERLRSLAVFSASGERVCGLAGETLSGRGEVVFSHVALAAGVHFLVVSTARSTRSAKFTVLR